MKGATAEPCVSTTKPPINSSMTMIGKSQNFFLSSRNSQSSETIDIEATLELFHHRAGLWSRWNSLYPVAVLPDVTAQIEEILASSAQEHADWHECDEE